MICPFLVIFWLAYNGLQLAEGGILEYKTVCPHKDN
jgi:hypothetical protein